MAKVRIVGLRRGLERTLDELYRLGRVQLADSASASDFEGSPLPEEELETERREELRTLLTEVEALLGLCSGADAGGPVDEAEPEASGGETGDAADDVFTGRVDAAGLRAHLDEVAPEVRAAVRRLEDLRGERRVLERYVEPLESVLPLMPELANLDESDLTALRLDTLALVLETDDDALVDALRELLADRLGARFELAWRRTDEETVVCLLAYPHEETGPVHDLLSHEEVRHVTLPEAYERLSLHEALAAMRRRLDRLPAAVAEAREAVTRQVVPHLDRWVAARAHLGAELERLEARDLVGVTQRAFVIVGWVPREDVAALRRRLAGVGGELIVEDVETDPHDPEAPVLIRNRRAARPFEQIVRFLELPRPGTLDPTSLVALFLPLFFGAMVGDVVYGALLLGIAVIVGWRFGGRSRVVGDAARIIATGSLWAIAFGFVFGEALGNFARRYMGMEPLWFYRGSPDALEPLLLFALALGAGHVLLGLAIGIWQAWAVRRRRELSERIGSLVALVGAFGVAGVALDLLPGGSITPAFAAILVGLVVVMAMHGRSGPIVGPIELLGVLGNCLSYLRVAAVGIASVYLAIVANEFAVVAPLWIGLIVAALLHALNLALASFSPMIQATRLHYVEFFTKFQEGGGEPFRPFGARTQPA